MDSVIVQLKSEIISDKGTSGSLNDGFGILTQDFVSVNSSENSLLLLIFITELWQIANNAAYSNIKFPRRPEGSTVNSRAVLSVPTYATEDKKIRRSKM